MCDGEKKKEMQRRMTYIHRERPRRLVVADRRRRSKHNSNFFSLFLSRPLMKTSTHQRIRRCSFFYVVKVYYIYRVTLYIIYSIGFVPIGREHNWPSIHAKVVTRAQPITWYVYKSLG